MYSVAPYFLSKARAIPPASLGQSLGQSRPVSASLGCIAPKVVAEAPVSAAVSALGGAALYPLVGVSTAAAKGKSCPATRPRRVRDMSVGLNRGKGKFERFVLTLVLEGLASGAR